jgi:protocatechuate 3,4-dioxygenase beta subunit
MDKQPSSLTRRTFLWMSLAVATPLVLLSRGIRSLGNAALQATAQGTQPATTPTSVIPPQVQTLVPTPVCGDDDDDDLTVAQTEGPYYTPNTPLRTSFLEPGINGTTLIVSGYVLSTDCKPVARALVDFWHCDAAGVYDNVGYKLRGHQFTDEKGRYYLETILPAVYPGRTRHIHVKVQAPNEPVLTSQLYFPNEAQNQRDGIFRPELLMEVQDTKDPKDGKAIKLGTFDFVLKLQQPPATAAATP